MVFQTGRFQPYSQTLDLAVKTSPGQTRHDRVCLEIFVKRDDI